MKGNYKVAGLGEVLWDIFEDIPTFGGAPANCACHCRMLGAEAYIISCVGDDSLGSEARGFLADHEIDTSALHTDSELETGIVNVKLDNHGKPSYEIKEDTAWDNIPFTIETATLAPQLDAICFGTLAQRNQISHHTVTSILDATSPDCLRVFDINIRLNYYSKEVVISSLDRANILKINDEELPVVADMLDISGSDEELLHIIMDKFNLKLVILTCGSQGAIMMTPEEVSRVIPPKPEKIVSTVGAGDSFTAAAIMGFLERKPLAEINRKANAVASYVCTQVGAVPQLPAAFTN